MVEPYRMVFINVIATLLLCIGVVIYKLKYPQKKLNLPILLIIISLLPLISLLRKGTYESGLLSEHVGVAFSFYDSIMEGALKPLWSAKACSYFGCPLFIFHYPLPFYIASFFHFLGISMLSSIKLLLTVSFITSGLTMYYWVKDEIDDVGGFVGALFYLYAPYHLSTMHFRVSIGEVLSYVFPPLILLGIKRIVEEGGYKWLLLSSTSAALLVMSHQVTSLVSMPFFALYIVVCFIRQKKKSYLRLLYSFLSLFLGVTLSAFYWLPIIIEGKYIHLAFAKDVAFQPFWYYIYSPFQYRFGLLFQGQNGELYTNLGYIPIFILIFSAILFLKKKIVQKYSLIYLFLLASFLIYFLMMQKISHPIWLSNSILLNMQFTWRFLIEIAFIIGLIAAIVVKSIARTWFTVLMCFLAFAITILNWGNRKTLPQITDENFKYIRLYDEVPCRAELSTPIWVNTCSPWIGTYPKSHLESLNGSMTFKEIKRNSTLHEYVVDVTTDAYLKENTYYFPGWHVLANNQDIPIIKNNSRFSGIITFKLKKGLYKVDIVFTETPERIVGETASVITIVILAALFLFDKIYLHMPFLKQASLQKSAKREK